MKMEGRNAAAVIMKSISTGSTKTSIFPSMHYLPYREGKIMNRKVRSLEEALEVLIKLNVSWVTVCRAQNSICDVEVAFTEKDCFRVVYYDETHNQISIH